MYVWIIYNLIFNTEGLFCSFIISYALFGIFWAVTRIFIVHLIVVMISYVVWVHLEFAIIGWVREASNIFSVRDNVKMSVSTDVCLIKGFQRNFARTSLRWTSRSTSLMGNVGYTVSKWWSFQILKGQYVLNGLLFMQSYHTKRKLVETHTHFQFFI